MAAEHYLLVHHGTFTISGAALKAKVLPLTTGNVVSGAQLIFLPCGEGQVNLMELQVAN